MYWTASFTQDNPYRYISIALTVLITSWFSFNTKCLTLDKTTLLFSAERSKPPSAQFQSDELIEAAIIGLLGYLFGFKGFVAILSNGLDFEANDDQLVDIIFLLLAPTKNGSEHLQALASVSRLLKDKALVNKLRGCKSTESALAVISQSIRYEAA